MRPWNALLFWHCPLCIDDALVVAGTKGCSRVYTDQSTPPAGTYTDNVILDVGF